MVSNGSGDLASSQSQQCDARRIVNMEIVGPRPPATKKGANKRRDLKKLEKRRAQNSKRAVRDRERADLLGLCELNFYDTVYISVSKCANNISWFSLCSGDFTIVGTYTKIAGLLALMHLFF